RGPNKAHLELVVDPDRVLPFAIARQRLKMVAWRRPQVAEFVRGVEVAQLPARHLDQIGREAHRTFAVEYGFGGLVPEAPYHKRGVSLNDTTVKFVVSIDDTACSSEPFYNLIATTPYDLRLTFPAWPRQRLRRDLPSADLRRLAGQDAPVDRRIDVAAGQDH